MASTKDLERWKAAGGTVETLGKGKTNKFISPGGNVAIASNSMQLHPYFAQMCLEREVIWGSTLLHMHLAQLLPKHSLRLAHSTFGSTATRRAAGIFISFACCSALSLQNATSPGRLETGRLETDRCLTQHSGTPALCKSNGTLSLAPTPAHSLEHTAACTASRHAPQHANNLHWPLPSCTALVPACQRNSQ